MSQKLVERLQQEFGADILATGSQHGDATITVPVDKLVTVLDHLRTKESCEQLSDVAGVDFPDREKRFQVNYLMRSWGKNHRIRVKVDVAEDEPVPSVSGLYRSADWAEREVFDMFGIEFDGHPDLTRILMPEDWIGHPLRKDYDVGRIPVQFKGSHA